MKKAVINLGKSERTLGLTFVALSRLCSYKDFLIYPFNLERLEKISASTCLKPRLEEEKRIKSLQQLTLEKYNLFL